MYSISKKISITNSTDKTMAPFIKEDEPLAIVNQVKPLVKKQTKSKVKAEENQETGS